MYSNLDAERIQRGYTEEYVAKKLGITRQEYRLRSESGAFLESDALALVGMYGKSFEYLFF
ncbi:MAG: helix-turn-helix domain-containing protein [Chitinispirillales bacterium]|jgi:DNA-binding XRE family transcriptional regulator|nr:helix-turn-helix domain-containing protein [Chitinispirillales bacterium]